MVPCGRLWSREAVGKTTVSNQNVAAGLFRRVEYEADRLVDFARNTI